MIDKIKARLRNEPLTVKMILGRDYADKTLLTKFNRKIKNEIDYYNVMRYKVKPKIILYMNFKEKNYIVIRYRDKVYYGSEVEKKGINCLRLKECYILNESIQKWQASDNNIFSISLIEEVI